MQQHIADNRIIFGTNRIFGILLNEMHLRIKGFIFSLQAADLGAIDVYHIQTSVKTDLVCQFRQLIAESSAQLQNLAVGVNLIHTGFNQPVMGSESQQIQQPVPVKQGAPFQAVVEFAVKRR